MWSDVATCASSKMWTVSACITVHDSPTSLRLPSLSPSSLPVPTHANPYTHTSLPGRDSAPSFLQHRMAKVNPCLLRYCMWMTVTWCHMTGTRQSPDCRITVSWQWPNSYMTVKWQSPDWHRVTRMSHDSNHKCLQFRCAYSIHLPALMPSATSCTGPLV